MTAPVITVYGAYWCPDCRRSKQFLGEHQTPYRWVDIEQDKAGEAYVLAKNAGKRIIPTIEFADGTLLVEPSNAALATKLGLKMTAERSHYDLIVVGGGPAGLTAALYAAREGIATLVIERAALGAQAAATERLDNMPGFAEGIEGAEFADQLRQQAARFGVEMLQAQDVDDVHSHDNYHCRSVHGRAMLVERRCYASCIATRNPRQAILLSGRALPRALLRRSASCDLNEPPRCTRRAWAGR